MQKTTTEIAELEVFIPGPGENPDDPDDAERAEFLAVSYTHLTLPTSELV